MSRSYRHTPICGICICDSEKPDKKWWHRRLRAVARMRLQDGNPDEVLLPHDHEVSDIWDFGKDGKWRFDPQEYPHLMRK